MPLLNIEHTDVRTTTVFEQILDNLNEKIKLEEEKSPLTDREQIFVETIRDTLFNLDRAYRRW